MKKKLMLIMMMKKRLVMAMIRIVKLSMMRKDKKKMV